MWTEDQFVPLILLQNIFNHEVYNMGAHLKLGAIPSIGVPNPIESTVETTIEAPHPQQ